MYTLGESRHPSELDRFRAPGVYLFLYMSVKVYVSYDTMLDEESNRML